MMKKTLITITVLAFTALSFFLAFIAMNNLFDNTASPHSDSEIQKVEVIAEGIVVDKYSEKKTSVTFVGRSAVPKTYDVYHFSVELDDDHTVVEDWETDETNFSLCESGDKAVYYSDDSVLCFKNNNVSDNGDE